MYNNFTNRYWELDNYKGMLTGKLYFDPYGNDYETVITFQQDKNDSNLFWYESDFLHIEQDCIHDDSVDEAMEEFEYMIVDHIEDEISKWENIHERFQETES